MGEQPLCAICGKRRPRRFCPGIEASICAICCGTEREVTVNCPLNCQYLREARSHERLPPVQPSQLTAGGFRITDEFLTRTETLLILLASSVAQAALKAEGAIDQDVRQALDTLVETYTVLQSGLLYEGRPANPVAAAVVRQVRDDLEKISEHLVKGGASLSNADVLGLLTFLRNTAIGRDNGRPKGRVFIDFLREFFPPGTPGSALTTVAGEDQKSLIITP